MVHDDVTDGDRLVLLQELMSGLVHLRVLALAGLVTRLVSCCFALELGTLCILGAGNGRRLLIGALPLFQRFIAFGEALIELFDRLALFFAYFLHLLLGCRRGALGVRNFGL